MRTTTSVGRRIVGGLFLVTGGVHLGLVAADPQVYAPFADHGLFGFVRVGWRDIVMAEPATWGLLAAAGEILLGILLLSGDRSARWGWAGAILFHVLLMLFGWGFWAWSVPVLAILVLLARPDFVGPPPRARLP